jgi:hypothetical protein
MVRPLSAALALAEAMAATMRLFTGNQLGKGFEELIVIVVDMLKNDHACLLSAQ